MAAENKKKFFWKDYDITYKELFLFVGIVLVILFCVPLLLTQFHIVDFTKTGNIGDTIGGITAPFLSLLGSVLVFIAFKEQIKANKLVQAQFSLQQFETQFFEMLKLHKDNVNEMFLATGDGPHLSGRDVLYKAANDIAIIFSNLQFVFRASTFSTWSKEEDFLGIKFYYCYSVFWSGSPNSIEYRRGEQIVSFAHKHLLPLVNWRKYLSHYHRHLFYLVDFINKSTIISEKDKYHYYKTVRSQLSSEEQLLLFYSWCTEYGSVWENGSNNFFTKYKFIHNMPVDKVIQNQFFFDKLDYLRKKAEYFGIETLFETEGG